MKERKKEKIATDLVFPGVFNESLEVKSGHVEGRRDDLLRAAPGDVIDLQGLEGERRRQGGRRRALAGGEEEARAGGTRPCGEGRPARGGGAPARGRARAQGGAGRGRGAAGGRGHGQVVPQPSPSLVLVLLVVLAAEGIQVETQRPRGLLHLVLLVAEGVVSAAGQGRRRGGRPAFRGLLQPLLLAAADSSRRHAEGRKRRRRGAAAGPPRQSEGVAGEVAEANDVGHVPQGRRLLRVSGGAAGQKLISRWPKTDS